MKSTKYSNFCQIIFGRFFKGYKKDQIEEKNLVFVKANIEMSYEEYFSVAMLNILISLIFGIVFSFIFYQLIPNFYTELLILIIPLSLASSLAGFYIYYPTYCINKRGRDIDMFLPYAINFISSMAVAGISPAEIFQTLSNISVYGEIQTEAKKITNEIQIMGIDNISALKYAIDVSPSRKFKTFIQGIVGTIQSGSDLYIYLSTVAKKYMEGDLIERRKDLDLLAIFAEVMVLSVIAFPIFLVIIVTVMGFFGGSMKTSLNLLLFFSFCILPLIYTAFYFLIRSTSIEKLSTIVSDKKSTLGEYWDKYIASWIILICSISSIIILYSFIQLLDYLNFINLGIFFYWDLFFISVLILIGPVGIFQYFELKKKKEMQEKLPDLLTELGDSLATGMTIFDSVKTAEKGNYGRLNPEIKKMKSQLSWNISIKNVLYDFAYRMKSAIVQRIAIVLDKGLMMGGKTPRIFKATASEVEQVNQLEFQRKSVMIIYALVIMVCFFVFLGIIMILDVTIFSVFLEIQQKQALSSQSIGILQLTVVDPVLLKYTMYSFVFVQSIGAGLLAGFMVDGKLASGVRFSCSLGIITIFVFKLLL